LNRDPSSAFTCDYLWLAGLLIASPSPSSIYRVITLLFKRFGVIDVLTAKSAAPRRTIMTTFTVDTENHITVHASRKAARDTGAAVFATEEQLADLIGPDNKRLVEIWNGLPGVKPVTKFANRKVATERIWKAIQGLGELLATAPAPEPQIGTLEAETPVADVPAAESDPEVTETGPLQENQAASKPAPVDPVEQTAAAEPVATVGARAPRGAPAEAESSMETTPPKKAPRAKKAAKPQETGGPREGSKTAQVVAMLQRKNGATLSEIMTQMGWQKHTVRGFMAGTMKKAGYIVESFKPEGGERTYRINS
jgi:hypothetical protein